MPLSNQRMWELYGQSWRVTPAPACATRVFGETGGRFSTEAVDLCLDPIVTIPEGVLIDPAERDVRDALEASWPTLDLSENRRWIWSVLRRPDWWFWFLRQPKLWRKLILPRPGMLLFPGHSVLGQTLEELELLENPGLEADGKTIAPRLAGILDGKTSIGRLFVQIHATAQTIHNGSHHKIRLELHNLGPHVVVLTGHVRICQLTLYVVEGDVVSDGCRHNKARQS